MDAESVALANKRFLRPRHSEYKHETITHRDSSSITLQASFWIAAFNWTAAQRYSLGTGTLILLWLEAEDRRTAEAKEINALKLRRKSIEELEWVPSN